MCCKSIIMEQKEVRIPIVGVIEESHLRPTNDHMYADHYPNGDGVYLVKFDDGSQELRSVMSNGKIGKDRERVVTFNFLVPPQVIAEEIKKEHEDTLKDAIESLRTDVIRAVNACNENMLKDNAEIYRAINELRESVPASCNGISEKTLLEALKVVAAGKHD